MGSLLGASSGVVAGGTVGGGIAYALASDGQCARGAIYGTLGGTGVGITTADIVDNIIRNHQKHVEHQAE